MILLDIIPFKDVLVVVADRWLNKKNLISMDTLKSIFINLLLGSALTLIGKFLLMVCSGIGGEYSSELSVRANIS